jgi:V/A-type H+-transporting ATPase subunit I
MIVPMAKVYLAARQRDRDRLLDALGGLGAVHLAPVDAARAVPEPDTRDALDRTRRAIQVLESVEPAGARPDLAAAQAVAEVLRIQREAAEAQARLGVLHRHIQALEPWGDTRLAQFESLRKAGVLPRFFAVPRKRLADVKGEFVHPIRPWPGGRVLVAVVNRSGDVLVPEGSEELPLPSEDRPTLRAEAAQLDAALKAGAARLAALAHLVPAVRAERDRLRAAADWAVAAKGGLQEEHVYALQGWVPEAKAPALAAELADRGVSVAVRALEPGPDEQPPTLIRYPWWARPMAGLFQVLGTVPGYREYDVSVAFMIALPIFAAILISDAGYGLLYLLLPIIFYRKMARAGARDLAHLIMVVGVLSLAWGLLTASFFGFDISRWMGLEAPLIPVDMQKEHMNLLMYVSITLGAIHLALAHLWRAWKAFPHLHFLSEAGWAVWFWGMFGVVRMLLLKDPATFDEFLRQTRYPYLLVSGGVLAILFAAPDRNVLKMLGLGLAKFPLAMIGTFGDTVSYVRLMAIGLGGSALAVAFNNMAGMLPIFATIRTLIFAHALNVALSIVALLAHGVRLNMLEFSNNLGMEWSGYAYAPFTRTRLQEEA